MFVWCVVVILSVLVEIVGVFRVLDGLILLDFVGDFLKEKFIF